MPNRPGILSRACAILAENKININAMTVLDSVDNAVVRFLVDQPTKALLLLEQEELYVLEQDVVVLELENRHGALNRISQVLAEADINILYAYCTAMASQDSGCIVLRTDAPERTLEILSR